MFDPVHAGDDVPPRLLKKILGRQVEQALVDSRAHVLLHSGDIVTSAAVEEARQAGLLRELLNSASEECCIVPPAPCTRADVM